MAIAKKCDRCEELYEYYAWSKEFKNSEKSNGFILMDRDLDNICYEQKYYDLCTDRMRKLEAFIKNEEVSVDETN